MSRIFGLLETSEKATSEARKREVLKNIASASQNPSAGQRGHDPFLAKQLMSTGKYKGEATNTDAQRSVVQLCGVEAAKYGAYPGEPTFANFSYEGKSWVAIVPPNAVQDIDMMLEYFPAIVPAAHPRVLYRNRDCHS